VSGGPRVAIVGRQNVGKSTLVNRIVGHRATIAHGLPGVTRDRIELQASWRGRRFRLVDTAGYLRKATGVEALAAAQAELATRDANLILLVVDAHAGISEEDADLARRLRRTEVPVMVVANKVDSRDDETDVPALLRLGLGEPFAVSALHGLGVGELLDRLIDLLPEGGDMPDEAVEARFAIVGRPNVGKSSLFNRLVGEERSIVSEAPGTTRDAVDSLVEWPELGRVRFVDTAGMRRGQSVRGVEYYGFLRARAAIDRAHVSLLVIDAVDGFTTEDRRIAAHVMEAGRALLVVTNKWDLEEDKDRTYKRLRTELQPFARAEVVRTSALTGQGVHRLPPLLLDLQQRWSARTSTSKINEIVQAAQRERPTPRQTGTLHYATQVSAGPPTVVIFGGARAPGPTYQRFIENRLRAALDLEGVPIRLRFRPRGARRAVVQ
jgi:GTP-binding protein